MSSTADLDVVAFHREYDRHPDDRVRLFSTLREIVPADATILYPGSYIDIGPSVWFDRVTYVDVDKRAARFFAKITEVNDLIVDKRNAAGNKGGPAPTVVFHHLDYQAALPIDHGTVDVLISLYAGFISEHCTRYLKPGGLLVANNSHGDVSMATLDPGYELVAVIQSSAGGYRASTTDLETYLQPKRGHRPTVDELHEINRGIAYTKPAYAYVLQWTG